METERDDDLDFYPFGPEHVPAPGTPRGPGAERSPLARERDVRRAGPRGPNRRDADVADRTNDRGW